MAFLMNMLVVQTTNIDITNKEKIIESLGMVKNCKDVEFTILGISLSGLNFFTSLLIVLFSLRALFMKKTNKKN